MTYVRRPVHFAFGKRGEERADSPCGIYSMWHRGLPYTREVEQVTCGHCRRWLRKQAAANCIAIDGTAERLP